MQHGPTFAFGQMHSSGRGRNENLEARTFADACFDVVVTQDVFEHLFHPGRAMREIARKLKPGGVAVMTVPVVRGWNRTERRGRLTASGEVEHLLPEEYHGNPVGNGRSLVTMDWWFHIGDLPGKGQRLVGDRLDGRRSGKWHPRPVEHPDRGAQGPPGRPG